MILLSKNLEKYKNKLQRSTTAYEILLDKELSFYTNTDPILAELIILIQDLANEVQNKHNLNREERFTNFKKIL